MGDDVGMTARTVIAAALEVGLDSLVADADAWVNVSATFLLDGHHRVLPPDRVVLELLEHEVATDDLLACVEAVRAEGYRVALDDFAPDSLQWALVPYADVVKVEFGIDGAVELIEGLVADGVTVLAEKVETPSEYLMAEAAGATMFQGYFFARPSIVQNNAPSISNLSGLHLLPMLCAADCDYDAVVQAVAADASLAARLLVACNSTASGLRRRVESVQDAVIFLGVEYVRRLALLSVIDSCRADTPPELIRLGVIRAELTRSLLDSSEAARRDIAYTVGLLSILDALTGRPMTRELFGELGLGCELMDAILTGDGDIGAALATAVALVEDVAGADPDTDAAYRDAVAVADEVVGMLAGR